MIDRDRISSRVSLETLRLELRRSVAPLLVIAAGFLLAAVAAVYIITNINGGIGATHTVRFAVADATGVVPNRAEVRFYGIQAGVVSDVELSHGEAVLTAVIADRFGNVYRNARAVVRPNTALQDMYLDITDRGSPRAGVAGPGYVVPLSQTASPVNLADVLDTFSPGVRAALTTMLDQFGNGLADHGADLRRAFSALAPFLTVAGRVAAQLAERADLTRQLVHNTSVLASVLASRSVALRSVVLSGTRSLEAIATDGGRPLAATVKRLPGTLAAGSDALSAALSLTPQLDAALATLGPVSVDLPAGVQALSALARSATPALRQLREPVRELLPLSEQVDPLAGELSAALANLSPQIPSINRLTQGAARCMLPIDEFFNWDASAVGKFFDSRNQAIRGNLHFGFYTVPTVKQTTYTYGRQCDGGSPIGGVPTPKLDGPAPQP
jgi:phospholipid/cholesterol/gamma-HCH transport system substrate-binding protein